MYFVITPKFRKHLNNSLKCQRAQNGVALVVVLLFLVAITGISVWTARQSTLAESVARNQLDQDVARQAAEAALRDAERDIDTAALGVAAVDAVCQRAAGNEYGPVSAPVQPDCPQGICRDDSALASASNWDTKASPLPWWPSGKGGAWVEHEDSTYEIGTNPIKSTDCDSFKGGVPLGTYTGVSSLKDVAKQPEYLIEVFQRKHVRINIDETQVSSTGSNANKEGEMYRITARGFGYSERTQVVLQSIFFP